MSKQAGFHYIRPEAFEPMFEDIRRAAESAAYMTEQKTWRESRTVAIDECLEILEKHPKLYSIELIKDLKTVLRKEQLKP